MAIPPVPDEEQMRVEIRKAMQEVKKMDLEKIINEALRSASLSETILQPLLNFEKLPLTEKDKEILRKELKEKQILRMRKMQSPKQLSAGSLVNIDYEMAPQMAVANNIEDLDIDVPTATDTQLIKLKLVLLKELKDLLTIKMIPVIYREQKNVQKEVVVQHQ
jgi:hypothetical protein